MVEQPLPNQPLPDPVNPSWLARWWKIGILIVLAFGLIIVGIWMLRSNTNGMNQPTTNGSANTNTATRSTFERFPTDTRQDTDADGLTDQEEAKYGTNPELADSDGDGLTDREEIQVYQTDPLKADTDGDGRTDSQEVQAGTNPNGDGQLRDLPSAIQQLQSSSTNN